MPADMPSPDRRSDAHSAPQGVSAHGESIGRPASTTDQAPTAAWVREFEHAGAGVLVCSSSGELLGANAAGRALVGVEPADFAQPLRSVLARASWRRESGETIEATALPPLRVPSRGGDERASADVVRVSDAGTNAGEERVLRLESWSSETGLRLTLITDLTDRAEAERVTNAVREELRRAGKLEAIARLSRGLAHDFRNVAAAIRAAAQRAQGELFAGGNCAEAIDAIREASEHAIGLTRDLSAFAGAAPGRGRTPDQDAELDFRDVIRGTTRLAQLAIAPNIHVRTQLPDQPVPVAGDAAQLGQVVMNLVLNGAQAMPLGGELLVQLRTGAHGRSAELRICDAGQGMDPDTIERATEPYFTTRREHGGTGLGLSIALGIVREHSGSLRFHSASGQGTTAIVTLPIRDDTTDPPRPRARDASWPSLEPGSAGSAVLIAPPSPMRGVLVGVLADFGLQTEAIEPADAAGEPCNRAAMTARLIVIDSLPPVTSEQLRAAIRALGCEAHCLILLPEPDPNANRPTPPAGATVLTRPFTIAELRDAIRNALHDHPPA